MSRHIEPRRRNEMLDVGRVQPVRRVVLPADSQLTRSDQRHERHAESRHAVRLHDLERQGVEGVAEVARDTGIAVAEVEGAARVAIADVEARARVLMAEDTEKARRLSELKWQLLRAKRESQLASEDMELAAKFAVLDDDYFQDRRAAGIS